MQYRCIHISMKLGIDNLSKSIDVWTYFSPSCQQSDRSRETVRGHEVHHCYRDCYPLTLGRLNLRDGRLLLILVGH